MALGKAIDKQQAEIARMERFIERFRAKATKARQAQSRVKKLSKVERIERDPRDEAALAFQFKAPERTGRVIFELSDARVEVGGSSEPAANGNTQGPGGHAGGRVGEGPIVLLDQAELWLERGEHVSLVGPNGAGKTTLIETLAGRRPLAAGKLSTGHNVTVGYLSQHAEELGAGGPPGQTVVEAAQRATGLTPNKARALVGRFLFSGENAEKPLEGLSGGERRRLSLAILMNGTPRPPNVLILDEPTNHLDIESREALEDALRAFTGAILLVSHDRALLDAVGARTVAIEQRTLHSYLGGWPEYVRVREERAASPDGDAAAHSSPALAAAEAAADGGSAAAGPDGRSGTGAGRADAATANGASPARSKGAGGGGKAGSIAKPRGRAKPKAKGPSKNRLSAQAKAEQAVEDAEAALRALEGELALPQAWATRYESAKSEARHTSARRAVDEAYADLEALIE
jgi:ATP-binding cassette, subfamily F, member 3